MNSKCRNKVFTGKMPPRNKIGRFCRTKYYTKPSNPTESKNQIIVGKKGFPVLKKPYNSTLAFKNVTRITYHVLPQTNPLFHLLKTTENKDKIFVTLDFMNELRDISDVLDRCCHLALRQSLTHKQLILLTDANFQTPG